MALKITPTSKFSVFEACSDGKQIEDDDAPDPNSALSMLGGSFAMWMFADDGVESEQMESAPSLKSTGDSSKDAETLLRSVISGGTEASLLADADYWRGLAEPTNDLYSTPLTVGSIVPERFIGLEADELGRRSLLRGLSDQGFAVVPPPPRRPKPAAAAKAAAASLFGGEAAGKESGCEWNDMARAVRIVEENGWPPAFALMFDEPWRAVQRAWGVAAAVLGPDCEIEPSIFIWSLRRNVDPRDGEVAPGGAREADGGVDGAGEKKRCSRIGQNFGLPHRDYSYEEAHFSDGRPRILNVWVPFTDADVDNGCLWVVPREFDPIYEKTGRTRFDLFQRVL